MSLLPSDERARKPIVLALFAWATAWLGFGFVYAGSHLSQVNSAIGRALIYLGAGVMLACMAMFLVAALVFFYRIFTLVFRGKTVPKDITPPADQTQR